jgi:hypothetical protein
MRTLLLAILLALFTPVLACAQGRYFNTTIEGGYQRMYDTYVSTVRTNVGVELGIPFTDYFELSVGHSLMVDQEKYNDAYRKRLIEKYGVSDLPKSIERRNQVLDTSINGGFGYPIGFFKPSIFGGEMWRKVCREDTFENYGCEEKPTWNAGVSLSLYLTRSLKFRVSYRITPSTRSDSKKTLDDSTNLGISWGI